MIFLIFRAKFPPPLLFFFASFAFKEITGTDVVPDHNSVVANLTKSSFQNSVKQNKYTFVHFYSERWVFEYRTGILGILCWSNRFLKISLNYFKMRRMRQRPPNMATTVFTFESPRNPRCQSCAGRLLCRIRLVWYIRQTNKMYERFRCSDNG